MTCLRFSLPCSMVVLIFGCGPKSAGPEEGSGATDAATDGGTRGFGSATEPHTAGESEPTTGVEPGTSGDETAADDETGGEPPPPVLPTDCGEHMISMPIDGLGQARVEPSTGGHQNLRLSKHDFSCGGPFYYPDCGGTWNVTVRIPANAQQVGTYDLKDFDVSFSESEAMQPPECGASTGGGGPGTGTLEILAWEEGCIAVSIFGLHSVSAVDLDGDLVAMRCP